MAVTEDLSWRKSIITQLHERNRVQTQTFQDIIIQNNRLFDNANVLRSENLQLSVQNEKLKLGTDRTGLQLSGSDQKLAERIQHLEQKLLAQQEELTELHRRKGENAQQIIDLNAKLIEKEKVLACRESSLDDAMARNISLQAEIKMYENSLREIQNLNQMLRDEHQALQLAFASLEDKLRKVQDENRQLVERLIGYKAKDAEKMNEENDNFLKKRNAKMQKELEEACRDTRGISPEEAWDAGPVYVPSSLPTTASIKFDGHEGDVNAVRWSPTESLLATGGADRKVKLWQISKGTYEKRGTLQGSNAGVMSVDFDNSGTLILGASNDFASRVWMVSDQRLKVTKEQQKEIQTQTVGQFNNLNYLRERQCRLTASNFGNVVKRRQALPCDSLVKKVLNHKVFETAATRYGKLYENVAIEKFVSIYGKPVHQSGLFVDVYNGFLGASPDGIISEEEIIEVKCLHKVATLGLNLRTAVDRKLVPCLELKRDGTIALKQNHNYYYQIQGQLAISG